MGVIEEARLKVNELNDSEIIAIFSEIGNRCLHGEQVYDDIYEIFEDYSEEEMQQLLYDSIYGKTLDTSDNYFVVDMEYIISFKSLAYCKQMIIAHMNISQAEEILHITKNKR